MRRAVVGRGLRARDGLEDAGGVRVFRAMVYGRPVDIPRLDDRVYVSIRYTSGIGGIRVSAHFYNDEEDVERLLRGLVRG